MKASAIVRIVLFSILIVILLGILVTGIVFGSFRFISYSGIRNLEGYTTSECAIPAKDVQNLEIDWVDGSITILPGDTDQITVQEAGNFSEDEQLVWKHTGSTLSICYSRTEIPRFWNFGGNWTLNKALTITVPRDWLCQDVQIDAVSASVTVSDLSARELDLDSVSGGGDFRDCTLRELNVDTTSGSVSLTGSADILDFDVVSANCAAELTVAPREVTMNSVSGNLELVLPEDAGYTANLDALSGEIYSDFGQTYGDGACHIDMDSVSGSLYVRKAA